MSANPLQRPKQLAHLPLVLLSFGFMVPLVWLVLSSLQPREQVGRVPPEFLPRQYFLELDGRSIAVTPPDPALGEERLLVVPSEGPSKGEEVLVPPASFHDGRVRLPVQEADRLVERDFPAALKQRIPPNFVFVKEWRLSKFAAGNPKTFYVDPARLHRELKPVLGNYPEAVRALTAGEKEKALPLPELLARTRFPWTSRDDPTRTITFLTYLTNTLLVSFLAVLGTTLSSALVAYGLSRISWKGRGILFAVTLATMMVPFPVLMIPLYSVFRNLGWIGTLKPLWVPAFFGSAFNIFLLRQFFLTIPKELSEAARIDGCSELGIFFRIMLPLSVPALAVVGLFQFLAVYNDFLGPLIYLTEPDTFTMALGLQQYQSQNGGSEPHLLMAASTLLVTPIIVLFFFAQKTFIQGIATTGIKG
jgi:multiple sugar transport system permease protein